MRSRASPRPPLYSFNLYVSVGSSPKRERTSRFSPIVRTGTWPRGQLNEKRNNLNNNDNSDKKKELCTKNTQLAFIILRSEYEDKTGRPCISAAEVRVDGREAHAAPLRGAEHVAGLRQVRQRALELRAARRGPPAGE